MMWGQQTADIKTGRRQNMVKLNMDYCIKVGTWQI